MYTFKERIAQDNVDTFINIFEFADMHTFLDKDLKCIVQDITVNDTLNEGIGNYPMSLFSARLQVNCLKDDISELPVAGQLVWLDGKLYTVEGVTDELGIANINLVASDR